MMGVVLIFMSCDLLQKQVRLFLVYKWFFSTQQSNCVFKFCHVMSFFALRVYFENNSIAFAEKPNELFSARLEGKIFAFVVKRLEQLENREILGVQYPKT